MTALKRRRGPGGGRTFYFSQYSQTTNIPIPAVVAKTFRRLTGNEMLRAAIGAPTR
jgi:hypothetical protein